MFKCRMRFLRFAFLLLACSAVLSAWSKASCLSQMSDSLQLLSNPAVVMEETTMSDIVTWAAGNSEAYQITLCTREQELPPTPDTKVYLLFPTWQLLWRSKGARGCYQMETVSGASHAFATFHHGIWHLVLVLFRSKWINWWVTEREEKVL